MINNNVSGTSLHMILFYTHGPLLQPLSHLTAAFTQMLTNTVVSILILISGPNCVQLKGNIEFMVKQS